MENVSALHFIFEDVNMVTVNQYASFFEISPQCGNWLWQLGLRGIFDNCTKSVTGVGRGQDYQT